MRTRLPRGETAAQLEISIWPLLSHASLRLFELYLTRPRKSHHEVGDSDCGPVCRPDCLAGARLIRNLVCRTESRLRTHCECGCWAERDLYRYCGRHAAFFLSLGEGRSRHRRLQ